MVSVPAVQLKLSFTRKLGKCTESNCAFRSIPRLIGSKLLIFFGGLPQVFNKAYNVFINPPAYISTVVTPHNSLKVVSVLV